MKHRFLDPLKITIVPIADIRNWQDRDGPIRQVPALDQVTHLVKEFESLHTEISVVRYKAA